MTRSGQNIVNVKPLKKSKTVEPTTRQMRGQLSNQIAITTTFSDGKTEDLTVQPSTSAGIIRQIVLYYVLNLITNLFDCFSLELSDSHRSKKKTDGRHTRYR